MHSKELAFQQNSTWSSSIKSETLLYGKLFTSVLMNTLYGGGRQKSWECQDSSDNALHTLADVYELLEPYLYRTRIYDRQEAAYLK